MNSVTETEDTYWIEVYVGRWRPLFSHKSLKESKADQASLKSVYRDWKTRIVKIRTTIETTVMK